jgi:hypothetical protein
MFGAKKVTLFEDKTETGGLLDETNIKDDLVEG